jgi:hypothetical protein
MVELGREPVIITLTDQQARELEKREATPVRADNPRTNDTYILLPVSQYEQLKEQVYDDSPWTREELQTMAWDVSDRTNWEGYDDDPSKS